MLIEDKEKIIKGLIEKLISYAHGREVTVADRPYVNDVFDSISEEILTTCRYMPSWITQRLGRVNES